MGNTQQKTSTPLTPPSSPTSLPPSSCPHAVVNEKPLPSACPAAEGQNKEGFNKNNNMMINENQKPHPNQAQPLSTSRVTSSIPRSSPDDKWVYPSPQMFYNAMKRKEWEPKEEDMDVIVAIHNNVNETAWQKILAWESLHESLETPRPKLKRFMGRPDDLTPKARIKTLFGAEKPFDRHDWIVDRDGKEVRYVIDFYAFQPLDGSPPITLIDARPALDSLESFLDRFRMRKLVLTQRYLNKEVKQ